jgi:hypothetical protein
MSFPLPEFQRTKSAADFNPTRRANDKEGSGILSTQELSRISSVRVMWK